MIEDDLKFGNDTYSYAYKSSKEESNSMDGWSVVDGLVPLDTKMPECLRYSSMSTTIRIPLNTYFEGEESDYESEESLLMFDCDDL